MRQSLLLAALAAALAAPLVAPLVACTPAAPTELRAADDLAGRTYVLRSVDGRPLPARVHVSAEGYAEILADTLQFRDDGTVQQRGAVRIVAVPPAVPEDRVHEQRLELPYDVSGAEVIIGSGGICRDPAALALCAAPDTGSVRGDSLLLAQAYAAAPRRAYVRLTAP